VTDGVNGVQDRVACDGKPSKLVTCLLQFGELEQFEACLVALAARNNKAVLNPAIATRIIAPSSSARGTAEEKPRLSEQLTAMREELARFVKGA